MLNIPAKQNKYDVRRVEVEKSLSAFSVIVANTAADTPLTTR